MRRRLRLMGVVAAGWLAAAVHAGDVRDPMRPAGARSAAPRPVASAPLRLEGVIDGGTPVAIVNGRVVRVGDVIGGARILDITAQGVRYERAGRIQTLTLPVSPPISTVRVARSPEANTP